MLLLQRETTATATFLIDELCAVGSVFVPVGGPVGHAPPRHRGVVVAAEHETIPEEDLEAERIHEEEDFTEIQEEEEQERALKKEKERKKQ